ncbi:MAG: UDP-N-acetylglucosamine 2-epimerase (non-hydrolyzing) [Candidatus Omnitrophica bacterium]|jgi:UDP-N-acetylglucosamine 2-epimerase (non-hydrolysing)|nr:UDP-N-acetylglucosamine 2-epimerase (non-hydrolyzing) [Candidatus Omnitrophota bacterium]
MEKIKVILVAGARPNFMKIAPIMEEMSKYPEHFETTLVHTGQHYDEKMSKLFFQDLEIPEPNIYLGVGSGSHAEQTAKIMILFEKVLIEKKPDLVIVVGDVNSTIACALTAAKLNIKIAHVEAGLRSFDRTMPEEINRILTDAISNYLFITEESAMRNLLNEGIAKEKIYFVGNVMIDTLLKNKSKADKSDILEKLELKAKSYALVTLHRPSNVDDPKQLQGIYKTLCEISIKLPVIFPVHPRTRKALDNLSIRYPLTANCSLQLIEPLGYLDFLKLMSEARVVLTDSGGMQEETTILKVPCLTIRENTERPVTIDMGTNILIGDDLTRVIKEFNNILEDKYKNSQTPQLWDGIAATRIIEILVDSFAKKSVYV